MTNHGTPISKQKSTKLIKSASSTLVKVLEMIEKDTYCLEIIQQIDSIIGLMKSTKKELLARHLNHCLTQKLEKSKDKTIVELLKIYNFIKLNLDIL